jgi:hypothetical protein
MAIAFERNAGSISYNSRVDSRYVVMVIHESTISLDEIKISYTRKDLDQFISIPTEVWIALIGVAGGTAIGIPMQRYYKSQRKKDLVNAIKKDLTEIKTILEQIEKEESNTVYIKSDEVAKISLKMYNETRVESSILLNYSHSKAVRDAYAEIKKTVMDYVSWVNDTREFSKDDHRRLLEKISNALDTF